jgi:hypothetical protein
MEPAPQNDQLMPKHRVLSLQPQLRLERRAQDGQDDTQKPDHSANLGDSVTSSTWIRFSYTQDAFSANQSWADYIINMLGFDLR